MELNIHEIEETEWQRKMDDTQGKAWHDSDRHVELMDILMDIRDALHDIKARLPASAETEGPDGTEPKAR